jgi:hypothetical protein
VEEIGHLLGKSFPFCPGVPLLPFLGNDGTLGWGWAGGRLNFYKTLLFSRKTGMGGLVEPEYLA